MVLIPAKLMPRSYAIPSGVFMILLVTGKDIAIALRNTIFSEI